MRSAVASSSNGAVTNVSRCCTPCPRYPKYDNHADYGLGLGCHTCRHPGRCELDSQMWLRMLGPVQVRDGAAWFRPPRPQLRLLLASLALSAGRVVPVEDLIDVMWEERPPPSARPSLQILVVRLRKALAGLPGCALERYGDGYRLPAIPDKVDVHRFRSLMRSAWEARDARTKIVRSTSSARPWRCGRAQRWPTSPGPLRLKRSGPGWRRNICPPSRTGSAACWRWAEMGRLPRRFRPCSPGIHWRSGWPACS